MDTELTITYLNNMETITKFNCESNKRFNERLVFIKLLEENKMKWKDANKLSKIWYNITFNNCKYSAEIYNEFMYYNKKYISHNKKIDLTINNK